MEEVIKLDEIDKYNKLFGLETRHPLVVLLICQKQRNGRNIAKSTTVYMLFT